MKILRSDLAHGHELEGAVVVIDVLRSFSTTAYAFAAGAAEVIAADSLEAVAALRKRFPLALTSGSRPGGMPVEGLDYGNSPAQIAPLDLAGATLIHYTAGGIRGLVDCDHASTVLAGSIVCARATVRYLAALEPPAVTLVVTGMWTDRDGDEDHACADLITALLRGENPPVAPYAARVRESDFGRRFAAGRDAHLPPSDLDLCAAVDRFDFAMPIRRTPIGLVITAGRIPSISARESKTAPAGAVVDRNVPRL